MNTTLDPSNPSTHQIAEIRTASPAYQAFRLLHIGFVAAPILAGMDKFFHLLVELGSNTSQRPSHGCRRSVAHNLMLVVGVIEIVAGIGSRLEACASLLMSLRRGSR